MGLSSRKTKAGLFFLAVFLGGALPCLLSLFRSTDALPLALLRSASLAVLVFLAQAAPFWVSLAGGYCVMAGGLLTRLPLLFALPAPVIAYEATTLLLVPLLLLGLTRLWLRMAVGMRLAFLFTAVSLLAVCLLMQGRLVVPNRQPRLGCRRLARCAPRSLGNPALLLSGVRRLRGSVCGLSRQGWGNGIDLKRILWAGMR